MLKDILKSFKLWICVAVFIVLMIPISSMTGFDGWFPFVHFHNAPAVLSWCVSLYFILTEKLTAKSASILAICVGFFTLPHLLFVVLVYSSWICAGVGVPLTVFLAIKALRLRKHNRISKSEN